MYRRPYPIGPHVIGPCLTGLVAAASVSPVAAQVRLDRADPTITEQALPKPVPAPVQAPIPVVPARPVAAVAAPATPRVARAIAIVGNETIPASVFAPVTARFVGRDLANDDLTALAGAVAEAARGAGYPFATASIAAQPMDGGTLSVTLDEGRLTAVRVIGAPNPLADGILSHALVGNGPVRRADLERALALVGDIPGVVVKESKYIRQDGFGILLVTIEEDRASAYIQVDNRGSAEVGPVRSTVLASLRGLAQSGDELGIIAANTPFQPSEFAFLRARYSAPVDYRGSVLSASGSYGHAEPGASLSPLDVRGDSYDATIAYSRPLIRSRSRSLWAAVELRALESKQQLFGSTLRDDRIATLSGSLNGTATAGPGVLRGEVAMVGGLPVGDVTHEGDPLASRSDGDARFVTWGYTVDWTAKLGSRLGLVLASAGQLASRPLLATAEIGAGGPAFGRAYDYAERTGDDGILGSAELRADAGRAIPGLIDRLQFYGFVDGGYVDNLRGGIGGGSLLSTGTGARLGNRLLDGMIEIAFPLNADRFDTRDRDPRISFRLSRSF